MGSNAEPTLGGVLACNLAGPRRVRAGAARDFFLGFSAVNGVGEIWKAGGKVVKNVTGYDMSKLLAGSFGTLSVLTEVTLKVTPKPETERTILLSRARRRSRDRHDGEGAEHAVRSLERRASASAPRAPFDGSAKSRKASAPSPRSGSRVPRPRSRIGWRRSRLSSVAARGLTTTPPPRSGRRSARFTACFRLRTASSGGFARRRAPPPSLQPTSGLHLSSAETVFDWGGGLVWLSLDAGEAGPDAGAGVVRAALKPRGGHATLIVADEPIARARRRIRAGRRLRSTSSRRGSKTSSIRWACSTRAGCGRVGSRDADELHRRATRRPGRQRLGKNPARLRALRLLHRDLSDLRAARRRTRQPARAHLPDQGHARGRSPGDAGSGQAYRPLPLLPLLHDDLPFGRELHAPRRSRAASHREDLSPPLVRPSGSARPRFRPAASENLSLRHDGRRAGEAVRRPLAEDVALAARPRPETSSGRRRRSTGRRSLRARRRSGGALRCSPAARSRFWRPRSTRPRSAS